MVIMLDGFLFRCLPLRRGRRIEDRRAFLVGRLLVVGSSDCVRAALENHLFGTRFKGLLAFIREMSDLCHQGLLTHGQGRTQCPLPRPNSLSGFHAAVIPAVLVKTMPAADADILSAQQMMTLGRLRVDKREDADGHGDEDGG